MTPLATPVNEYYYNQSFGTPDVDLYGRSNAGMGGAGQGRGRDTRMTGYEAHRYGGGNGGNGNRVRFADSGWDEQDLNGLR